MVIQETVVDNLKILATTIENFIRATAEKSHKAHLLPVESRKVELEKAQEIASQAKQSLEEAKETCERLLRFGVRDQAGATQKQQHPG